METLTHTTTATTAMTSAMMSQTEPTARKVAAAVTTDWKKGLPVLQGMGITLRELRMSDAKALLALLTTEEVTRFISPPPTTLDGFERFISWTIREREAGRYLCFAVVPEGYDTAVGLFQVRQLDPTFGTAEWGFAIGSGVLGQRALHGRLGAGGGICVRCDWGSSAGSPGSRGERPGQ